MPAALGFLSGFSELCGLYGGGAVGCGTAPSSFPASEVCCVMQFTGIIKPESHVHRSWRTRSQVSGMLDHIPFRWNGCKYVSNPLTTEEVEKIRARQDQAVQLEALASPPAPEVIKEALAETKAEAVPPPKKPQRLRLTRTSA